jgi:hypothetical protein
MAVPYHGSALATPHGRNAHVSDKKIAHPGIPWSILLPRKPLTAGRIQDAVCSNHASRIKRCALLIASPSAKYIPDNLLSGTVGETVRREKALDTPARRLVRSTRRRLPSLASTAEPTLTGCALPLPGRALIGASGSYRRKSVCRCLNSILFWRVSSAGVFQQTPSGFANRLALPQSETNNDLDVGDDWLCRTHSGLEPPAFQSLQSGVVHSTGCTADESGVTDGTVRQNGHGDSCVAYKFIFAGRLWIHRVWRLKGNGVLHISTLTALNRSFRRD